MSAWRRLQSAALLSSEEHARVRLVVRGRWHVPVPQHLAASLPLEHAAHLQALLSGLPCLAAADARLPGAQHCLLPCCRLPGASHAMPSGGVPRAGAGRAAKGVPGAKPMRRCAAEAYGRCTQKLQRTTTMRPITDVQAQRKVMVSLDDSDTSKKALEVGSQGPPACSILLILGYARHCPGLLAQQTSSAGCCCSCSQLNAPSHQAALPVVYLPHRSGR